MNKVIPILLALAVAAPAMRVAADSTDANLQPVPEAAPSPSSPTHWHWAPMTTTRMPDFEGATAWLNSPPLSSPALRGKVVLVDFWTFSCINWRREFPYVRAWAKKYRDHGLVVIGVHTPEFPFEMDPANVERAVRDIGVDYPVAVDSNRAIWRAFGNAYWPAIYLIDARGVVRYHHFGEGSYEATERAIQRALSEIGQVTNDELVVPTLLGAEAPADWGNLRSPENYVGLARTSGLAAGALPGQRRTYAAPGRLRNNEWSPIGDWILGSESAVLQRADGRIAYGFHARDLHLVMGPTEVGRAVRFRVLIDGKPPGAAHGLDVDEQGFGKADSARMYQLIRQPGPIRDRRFEIEFIDPGIEVFSFTFG